MRIYDVEGINLHMSFRGLSVEIEILFALHRQVCRYFVVQTRTSLAIFTSGLRVKLLRCQNYARDENIGYKNLFCQ